MYTNLLFNRIITQGYNIIKIENSYSLNLNIKLSFPYKIAIQFKYKIISKLNSIIVRLKLGSTIWKILSSQFSLKNSYQKTNCLLI